MEIFDLLMQDFDGKLPSAVEELRSFMSEEMIALLLMENPTSLLQCTQAEKRVKVCIKGFYIQCCHFGVIL